MGDDVKVYIVGGVQRSEKWRGGRRGEEREEKETKKKKERKAADNLRSKRNSKYWEVLAVVRPPEAASVKLESPQ